MKLWQSTMQDSERYFRTPIRMPRQVHAFANAVEEFASSSGVRHLASWEQDVQCILHDALTWAGRPVRTKKGRIQWKKMISFVEKGLVEDIQRLARIIFEKSLRVVC